MDQADDIADDAFVQSVLAASNDCIKVLSLDGVLTYMSEGGQRVMEVSDFNLLRGCPWPSFWEGESAVAAAHAVSEAAAGRNARFQGPANTAAGNPRWWDVQVTPIPGPDGKPIRLLSISRDMTLLKQAEDQQRLLALELNHRIKNMLAMVQAIAGQTFRASIDPDQARAAFMQRLTALADAQDLMTRASETGAPLAELVTQSLRAHGRDGQISASGPEVMLSARAALALSLALHERATNAVKYGALSTDAGRVTIAWSVSPGGDGDDFTLSWVETGGPAVQAPTVKGFGSGMIRRALSGYVGGASDVAWPSTGMVFTLTTTVKALNAEPL